MGSEPGNEPFDSPTPQAHTPIVEKDDRDRSDRSTKIWINWDPKRTQKSKENWQTLNAYKDLGVQKSEILLFSLSAAEKFQETWIFSAHRSLPQKVAGWSRADLIMLFYQHLSANVYHATSELTGKIKSCVGFT